MALIKWRKEFETGIPHVDYEHAQLVGTYQYSIAIPARISSVVTAIMCGRGANSPIHPSAQTWTGGIPELGVRGRGGVRERARRSAHPPRATRSKVKISGLGFRYTQASSG